MLHRVLQFSFYHIHVSKNKKSWETGHPGANYLTTEPQKKSPFPFFFSSILDAFQKIQPMDISDKKGGLRAHLLSHDPDAALCAGESSLHMASAPSDSVVRTSDNIATPTAPPGSLHPKLTTAVMLMRQGNYRDAIPLLEQAAADGSAEADVELAECFGQGWGTPHNPACALQHASRSASRGTLEGRYMVAW